MTYDVAIVGTGPDPTSRDRDGFAMGYRHAAAYLARDDCSLVGCADMVEENAGAFADHVSLPTDAVFTDHQSMLAATTPDIVSICVPPAVHANLVIDAARAASVNAIHCEKPMATRWEDCQAMVETCREEGVQLTIDHQRRFATPVRRAQELIAADEIGDIRRFEWAEVNLFDAGAHLFDLCDHFLEGGQPAWALAGVDTSEERIWFGTRNSAQAIATWGYEDGVHGLASTADGRDPVVDAYLRIVGTDGCIEIEPNDGPPLRIRTDGGWEPVDTGGEGLYGSGTSRWQAAISKAASLARIRNDIGPDRPNYGRAIDHIVECLDRGQQPLISGEAVLRSTELVFACWESARCRSLIDIPIDVVGNPLEMIIEEHTERQAPAQ